MRCLSLSALLSLAVAAGCGSSNSTEVDASTPSQTPPTPDRRPADSGVADSFIPDAAADANVALDVPGAPDSLSPDLAPPSPDIGAADLSSIDAGAGDRVADSADATSPADAAPADATTSADAASLADAFDPGPTVPIVVNSGNTATFNLGDGKWQRFSFPVEAGQIYAISELSGITCGYAGPQATVSPSNFTYQTDAAGRLIFTASATGIYYLAVAVVGGGVSGSFQVADGGRLLALGTTSLTLTAPNADDYFFFRFPVTAGKGYHMKITGPMQPDVGMAVSARAERSNNGQFSYSDWGVGGSLPFDEDITADNVAASLSGYYYFYLNLHGDMTVAVTISEVL